MPVAARPSRPPEAWPCPLSALASPLQPGPSLPTGPSTMAMRPLVPASSGLVALQRKGRPGAREEASQGLPHAPRRTQVGFPALAPSGTSSAPLLPSRLPHGSSQSSSVRRRHGLEPPRRIKCPGAEGSARGGADCIQQGAQQGWKQRKQPPLSLPLRSRKKPEGMGSSEGRPPQAQGAIGLAAPWVRGRGVWSWESIFCIIMFCATVGLVWHYCNSNKVLVPSVT